MITNIHPNIVLILHDQQGDTDRKTGFWREEFAAPYCELKEAGAQLTLVLPEDGQPPLDPESDRPDAQTQTTKRFKAGPEVQAELAATGKKNATFAG